MSPHGRRGAICAYFGWTYDYLINGIPWSTVQRMMIDAPSYDFESNEEDMTLGKNNREELKRYINSLM